MVPLMEFNRLRDVIEPMQLSACSNRTWIVNNRHDKAMRSSSFGQQDPEEWRPCASMQALQLLCAGISGLRQQDKSHTRSKDVHVLGD